ncbi:hypothetical protein Rhopal_007626-T1 [Rhodotorula paludigena]|uniref:Uncharacterized protein n=1 Tax=Rhodotorula paludigena TaxID=86838 RepID=A0AAV5GW78_9BASI|nr:hypothetical protein Rhopal_007626-T1 [Rhodotorula paludigena]
MRGSPFYTLLLVSAAAFALPQPPFSPPPPLAPALAASSASSSAVLVDSAELQRPQGGCGRDDDGGGGGEDHDYNGSGSAPDHNPSASAAASDSSEGSIFSPSNKLFGLGIAVIIAIVLVALLGVIYLIKRVRHLPRYADELDYPSGFPRTFFDDKALSKRWSRASHDALLDDAQVPAGSLAAQQNNDDDRTQREMGVRPSMRMASVAPQVQPNRPATLVRPQRQSSLASSAAPPASLPPAPFVQRLAPPPPPPKPSQHRTAPLPHVPSSRTPTHPAVVPPPSLRPGSPASVPARGAAAVTDPYTALPAAHGRTRSVQEREGAARALARHRWSPPAGRESSLRNEL